jgi:predicted ATPase/DNA-binding SARP family transcriptional activator
MRSMPAMEVRVLGPVEVVAGQGRTELAGKHARLLAALVVADGQALGVDRLVEAVWNGAEPASARKLVQVYVSQLRKTLPRGVEIVTRGSAYAAELAPDALDASRFERLLSECVEARHDGNPALALSLVDRALSLWRGRAYGELAYEDFARAESDRLEELRLVAVEERLAAQLALGRHAEVLGEVLAFAEENTFREHAHELTMLALYRSGRQSDALERFAAIRARLHDELGLEPGPSLRELQGRILQQDPGLELDALAHAEQAHLPMPPNPLVGRERELAELRALLESRRARLLVLTGAGGSGKTRLALEAARQLAGSYANGAVLVELAPLRDPELVVPTIAHALELTDTSDDPLTETLASALASRELLLVLDNAEHVREAAPIFTELLARSPRLTLLVTSRAVLHVSGEHVFPVAPLEEDDALELFVQRARLLDPGFARTDENDDDLREICRRVDGLPLAIELAAARIRTLSPRALRERLDERLSVCTGGPRDLPARQQTLRETIDWSVDLLGERERGVLARLAVFPAGATLESAEAVCGADLDLLGALVDDHLVRRDDTHGEPRFGMLETIREYALELLGDERPEVERALVAHLTALVERAVLKGPGQEEWLHRLDGELDNLRAALGVAAEWADPEHEIALAGGLWRYWWIRGALVEGLTRLERALARGDGGSARERARALGGAAGLAWALGDLPRAKALAADAAEVAQAVGALAEESHAHVVLGVAANREREWEDARRHLERSVAIAEELGVEPVVEKLNLGVVALDSGDYEAAAPLFEDVLASHRRNGVVEGIGFALLNLGLARRELGEHESSRRDFEEARSCFEQIGFREHVAHALQGLAAAEADEGRHEEAARLLGRARAELDEVGVAEDDFAPRLTEEVERRARTALGDNAFHAAYAAGRTST